MSVCIFRRRCHATHKIWDLAALSSELLLFCILASFLELQEQDVYFIKLSLKGIPLLVFADFDFDAVQLYTEWLGLIMVQLHVGINR